MKLAFIFDVRFTKFKNHYYSINLGKDVWENRYLRVFDEIIVIGRYIETDTNPSGKLVVSDSPKVTFKCIPSQSPFKRIISQKKEGEFILKNIADCDAVICRGWWGVKECKKLQKNYLIEAVSCYWDAYWNHGVLGKVVAPFEYLMQRIAIKNAKRVIYVTSKFLQKRYPTNGKSTNISNVMLSTEDDKSVLEERIRFIEEMKLDDKIILGTAAAIDVKYKGQENVIKALAILKSQGYTNYHYQLIGKGDPTYLLSVAKKYHVEDKVEFLGSKPHDLVNQWLDSIHIYIQPSLQEGLPRSVIEAMNRGLPCAGSHTGGIPELLEPQYYCKSNFKMPYKLAKIIKLLSSKAQMKSSAKRNYEESKKYKAEILEERRYAFLKEFADS